jgi:hypothetical protein
MRGEQNCLRITSSGRISVNFGPHYHSVKLYQTRKIVIIVNYMTCYGLNLIIFNKTGLKENRLIPLSLEDVKKPR